MAITVKHQYVSAVPDGGDTNLVQPSDWNDDHVITGNNVRELLTANRTYYVRSDGNDSNTGLVDSSGGAFLTIQRPVDIILGTLDASLNPATLLGYQTTINVGAGTFVGASFVGPWPSQGSTIKINGAGSASTTITTSSSVACIFIYGSGLRVEVANCKLSSTSSFDNIIHCAKRSELTLTSCVIDPNATTWALYVLTGGYLNLITCEIIAGCEYAIFMDTNAGMFGRALTITGNPAWSNAFIYMDGYSSLLWGTFGGSITGSATGKQFSIYAGSVDSSGVGINLFPGDVVGTFSSASTYDGYFGALAVANGGIPTTTELPLAGTAGIFKDTSGGGVYLAYNDGGTIKYVTLT